MALVGLFYTMIGSGMFDLKWIILEGFGSQQQVGVEIAEGSKTAVSDQITAKSERCFSAAKWCSWYLREPDGHIGRKELLRSRLSQGIVCEVPPRPLQKETPDNHAVIRPLGDLR